ncbi:MAG: SDR family oxidoreductase, partial [Pseudomonadales bacterium]|nr:SDR family oxidoreductase [Pseudomonadales bacterium]
GLGIECARQYAGDGWDVIGTCRDTSSADELQNLARETGRIRIEPLDVDNFDQVDSLARTLEDTPIDLLINNAGIGGPRQESMDMDESGFMQVLHTNTLAPLKICQAFRSHVAASDQKKMAVISSGLGSINNNTGGRYAYRTSKAAVNMIMKGLAADWAGDGILVAIFAPGWVRTDMGGPNAMYSPEESIAGMRKVLEELTPEQSGRFLTHTGNENPW